METFADDIMRDLLKSRLKTAGIDRYGRQDNGEGQYTLRGQVCGFYA